MRRKSNTIELSVQELRANLKGKPTKKRIEENQIDYSEIPKFSKTELSKFKKVGRPLVGDEPRKAISIRIDEGVLRKIKSRAQREGIAYQSLINEILKKAV